MYTYVERRTLNTERMQETVERGENEFFPYLRKASGFSGFYLVSDEVNSSGVAIIVWESKAHSDAFDATVEASRWREQLEQFGLFPLCYGASLNVYPSGIARNMAFGLKAYRIPKDAFIRLEHLVDIFDTGDDV